MADASEAKREEAEAHFQRTKTRPGTIVGRPASQAELMRYEKPSTAARSEPDQKTQTPQTTRSTAEA